MPDLASLKRLPKLHLCWPFQQDLTGKIPMWNAENRDLLKEYVRIAGALPLSLEWYTPDQLQIAADLKSSVCLSTSPYRRLASQKRPASYIGPDWSRDLDDFVTRMDGLRPLADRVKYVMIDVEHWRASVEDRAALLEKYIWLDRVARDQFPSVKVIFYGRGGVQPDASADGWSDIDRYPPGSPGDFNTCSLYYAEWAFNQQVYLRAKAKAGDASLVPFLALGGGYPRQGTSWGPFAAGGPGSDAAWQIGLELNHPWAESRPERFPLSSAPLVFFWPAPFDPKYPAWADQFVAYCKGAANEPLTRTAS